MEQQLPHIISAQSLDVNGTCVLLSDSQHTGMVRSGSDEAEN
jgi:hypothetical protein